MLMPLSKAPYSTPLVLEAISSPPLSKKLKALGINRGDVITRLSEEINVSPVRVRTLKGEVVLASGMAGKVITHHDDGHKTPISEMEPGETGHVEGLICGGKLEQSLATLGIRENDQIEMIRRIPPMDYLALAGGNRVVLSESMAAKLWGKTAGGEMQFAMSRAGEEFEIISVLGGGGSVASFSQMGLGPGAKLVLESVRPAMGDGCRGKGQSVICTQSGLRLYLSMGTIASMMVSPQ